MFSVSSENCHFSWRNISHDGKLRPDYDSQSERSSCLYRLYLSTTSSRLRRIHMKLLHNTSQQKKVSEEEEIRPFRSEVHSSVVGDTTLKTTDLTGLGP